MHAVAGSARARVCAWLAAATGAWRCRFCKGLKRLHGQVACAAERMLLVLRASIPGPPRGPASCPDMNGAMLDLAALGTGALALVLALATVSILGAGVRLSRVAQQLAQVSGLGEAVVGSALLGASTSLSGAVVSVTAAAADAPALAAGNAVGGIAVQTFFLALADLCYRGVNLEHAAASPENMANAALLGAMLALVLLLPYLPPWLVAGVHPGSLVLLAVYVAGLRSVAAIRARPMWTPLRTVHTRLEPRLEDGVQGDARRRSTWRLLACFIALAAVLALAGWVVAAAGAEAAQRLHARQSAVGALLTAVITSLPELVTTLAAVRLGALQLAVAGIIGGNTFDVLFLAFADIAYRDGSLYHVFGADVTFWLVLSLLMTMVLSFGLVRRERFGPGNIGSESLAVLVLYLGAVVLQLG